jgi:heat-inducible transcriptional repressor
MQNEDEEEYEESYLDGLHFTLSQPEFTRTRQMANLVELSEQRNLLRIILPKVRTPRGVWVVIGKENEEEAIRDYSVVISQYGLPEEAVGNLAVVGPTRMPYARSIAAIDYLSSLLSNLVARLYGKEVPSDPSQTSPTKENETEDLLPG